jgi:hypothetical protein
MSLRDAVESVGKIEKLYRSSPIDRLNAAKLIGYTALSGPANKALAALSSYGLLESSGKGEARVTERARDILHANSKEQRIARLFDAAMEPELFREIRERFVGISVPPEDGVVTYLNRQGFNPNAVRPAAKAFLETMSYLEELGANESHGLQQRAGADSSPPPGSSKTEYGGAAVGDLIQWEANGSLQFPKPARVRAISKEGDWVFVEQSETGIPMNQVIVEEKAPNKPPTLALDTAPVSKGMRREVFALDEGDVVLTFPENLSPASYSDLEGYLQLFLRKAKRQADKATAERYGRNPDEE